MLTRHYNLSTEARHRRLRQIPGQTGVPRRGRPASRSWLAIVVLLAVVTWFVFGQARHFAFVNWDDHEYVTENAHVRDGLTASGVVSAFTLNVAGNWQPVTVISHQIDTQLFGLDAGAHHLTSVFIHLANGLILFGLLHSLTSAMWRAAFVSAIFLVHPLHVESVAWIAERKDVLSTCLALMTMWAYATFVRRPTLPRYLAVATSYALALMAKPMVITLPLLLLLVDAWPLKRVSFALADLKTWMKLAIEKLPLFAMAAAVGIVTLSTQQKVGAVLSLDDASLYSRVVHAIVSYATYLWKTLWPVDLSAFYPYHAPSAVSVVAALVALAAISALAIHERIRHPYLLAGWLWFLLGLAPVIGIVQVGDQAMADRYTYFPMVGVLVALVWGVCSVMPERASSTLTVIALVPIALSATVARAQAATWRDSITLWRHAASVTTDNSRALENLGTALRESGDLVGAFAAYSEAIRIAPRYAVLHNSLGLVLVRQGRIAEAIASFEEAVRLYPDFVEAQTNLGNALAADERLDEAILRYRESLRLKPDASDARIGLGSTLLRLARAAEAQEVFAEAVRLTSGSPEAHNGLGAALATQGQHAAAIPHYREAIRLKPTLVTALANLSLALVNMNDRAEAKRYAEEALRIDPNNPTARRTLAYLSGK